MKFFTSQTTWKINHSILTYTYFNDRWCCKYTQQLSLSDCCYPVHLRPWVGVRSAFTTAELPILHENMKAIMQIGWSITLSLTWQCPRNACPSEDHSSSERSAAQQFPRIFWAFPGTASTQSQHTRTACPLKPYWKWNISDELKNIVSVHINMRQCLFCWCIMRLTS